MSNIRFLLLFFCVFLFGFVVGNSVWGKVEIQKTSQQKEAYWLLLYRKTNKEVLYLGVPGEKQKSRLIRTFSVKTGIPGERPTPLPKLLGRAYWVIVEKHPEPDNDETAPYFLTLNIPAPSEEPYGPVPYTECNGQCHWVRPGAFGLHGIAGNQERLSKDDRGSSGCIRHRDEDITFLFHLLNPQKEEVRYYIEDT